MKLTVVSCTIAQIFFNLSVVVHSKTNFENLFTENRLHGFFSNVSYYEYYMKNVRGMGKTTNLHDDLKCFNQVKFMWEQVTSGGEIWARLMFDAWGKLQSGILSGNLHNWGHFEQCLRVQSHTQYGDLQGQHCVIHYQRKNAPKRPSNEQQLMIAGIVVRDMNLATGICMPESCSPEFVHYLMGNFLNQSGFEIADNDLTHWCHTNHWPAFRARDIVAIVFFSTIAGLMVASTIYDVLTEYFQSMNGDLMKITLLLAFSMYTNGKKLFAMKRKSSPEVIDCIHGIRVISLVWIILGHRYVAYTYTPVMNWADLFIWITEPHSVFITAAPFAVDTFLVMSGLLVTWSVFTELEKQRHLRIFMMYIHRYLRLTPALGAMIFMYVTLFKHMGSGPLYTVFVQGMATNCERNWWTLLLYVQNYVHPLGQCMTHTWYLAVDFQLYLLAPFILYPLWRWRIQFLWVIPIMIMLSMACIFTTVYYRDLRVWALNEDIFMAIERLMKIYYPTHTRYGTYLVGVLTAYFLFEYRNRPVRIPKLVNLLLWLVSLAILFTMVFAMLPQQQVYNSQTKEGAAFFEAFSRVGWSIGLAWIIFACANGLGGPIGWLLGHPAFQPLSRMSYSIFLTHLPIQMLLIGAQRQPGYIQDVHLTHQFWGDLGFTFTISVFWSLAFEFPIPILEKCLFGLCFGVQLKSQAAASRQINQRPTQELT